MTKFVDPKLLGLRPQTTVEEVNQDTLAIVINRKSRIIMADGKKLLDKAARIKKAKPGCKIMLKTTAPVCSKTLQYLADHGILVLQA